MSQVIDINSKRAFSVKRKSISVQGCSHLNVELDEEERIVRCVKCEAVLSGFDYLLNIAHKEDSAFHQYVRLSKEVQKLEAKYWELKTKIHQNQ